MAKSVFKKVPEDLSEKETDLNIKYDESSLATRNLERELIETKVSIAKLEVEDILKEDFSKFNLDLYEVYNLDYAEGVNTLQEVYLKIIKSIAIELKFLMELSKVVNNDLPSEKKLPTTFEELEPYVNVLNYNLYGY